MHAHRTILLAFAALTIPALTSANAATLVPVTPPAGATSAIVFGINHHDVIAGEYVDAGGVEHGFTGPVNGTYTIIDFGGATATEPRALDDDGDINGFAQVSGFSIGEEFFRQADGTIFPIEKNGTSLNGLAQGITKFRTSSTGDYLDPNTGIRTGYLGLDGTYASDINLGLTVTQTSPRAINKHGTYAGFYVDGSGATHGFILRKNGITQTVDADSSGTTVLEGINSKEIATGFTTDSSGNRHAFVYDTATGTFTSIVINDGSAFTEAWGIDDDGMVGTSTSVATYIYCLSDNHCPKGGTRMGTGHSWKTMPGTPLHRIAVRTTKAQIRP